MLLRASRDTDLAALTQIYEIYAHYVRESSATFEIEPPDEAEMGRRRAAILGAGLPYIVAEEEGVVVGYAYATMYRPRKAYRFTVEDSIYLHPEHAGKGIGRVLLTAVIEECRRAGFRQMIAVIGGSDNLASIGLHKALGFEHAGLLSAVGYKFGRWTDTVLMQRKLRVGGDAHPMD